jgi:hypothetical protein
MEVAEHSQTPVKTWAPHMFHCWVFQAQPCTGSIVQENVEKNKKVYYTDSLRIYVGFIGRH